MVRLTEEEFARLRRGRIDPVPTEEQEQRAVVDWARFVALQVPELGLLYHIPNGGYRLKSQAAKLVGQGVLAGIPDLHLPVPRQGAASLYIEMKARNGHPSIEQTCRAVELVKAGNCVAFCFGFHQAEDTLRWYLGIQDT